MRKLLVTPPLSADIAQKLPDALKGEWPRGISRTTEQQALARDIRGFVEQNLAQAESLLVSVSTPSGRR
ncbi:hypothetical protein D3C87_2029040 [compost metagenome]